MRAELPLRADMPRQLSSRALGPRKLSKALGWALSQVLGRALGRALERALAGLRSLDEKAAA